MKVGSLVECINNNWDAEEREIYPQVVFPVLGEVYVVREVLNDCGKSGIKLEEIINPPLLYRTNDEKLVLDEKIFNVEYFRELQPPMDLSMVKEMQLSGMVKY